LARQVITRTRHIWPTLRRARQGHEDDVIDQTRVQLEQQWDAFAGYFETVATRYERLYHELQIQPQPDA
jgi:predicted metalloprotease